MNQSDPGHVSLEATRTHIFQRRRPGLRASLAPRDSGTEVLWDLGNPATEARNHLALLEKNIPVRYFHYSGIPEAAGRSGAKLTDRETIRALVNVLAKDEVVDVLGHGLLEEKSGWVLLTNRHLIFVTDDLPNPNPTLKLALTAEVNILFGKKIAGETLTLTHRDTTRVISSLGHGEGHLIIKQARQVIESAP